MKKETAEKKHTISLSDERPVIVTSRYWPVVASASEDRDHNNQELFRRYFLRVRQHDNGQEIIGEQTILNPHSDERCLVYGWGESSWQGESGKQAGYRCQIEDVPAMIRKVAEYIGADESLADDCIADLPPMEEDEGDSEQLTVTLHRHAELARKLPVSEAVDMLIAAARRGDDVTITIDPSAQEAEQIAHEEANVRA